MIHSPLTLFPDTTVTLPLNYAGSVDIYAIAAIHGASVIDCRQHYNKRSKDTHRTTIADTHGPLRLTVPVAIPALAEGEKLTWEHILVSPHGRWWAIHLTALESAYGRTPYFQFYIDRFAHLFTRRYEHEQIPLWQLDRDITHIICDILGIPRTIFLTSTNAALDTPHHSVNIHQITPLEALPYYQVRNDRFGFIPHLSILDLIFNLGPEAPLYIHKITKNLPQHLYITKK